MLGPANPPMWLSQASAGDKEFCIDARLAAISLKSGSRLWFPSARYGYGWRGQGVEAGKD